MLILHTSKVFGMLRCSHTEFTKHTKYTIVHWDGIIFFSTVDVDSCYTSKRQA